MCNLSETADSHVSKKYKFTQDFNLGLGGAKSNITKLVEYYGLPLTSIEIGCFEGGTTFWLAESIGNTLSKKSLKENFKIYAIDPHDNSLDLSQDMKAVKRLFDYNLQVCPYKDSIEYMRKKSSEALVELISKGVKANLIYIDGDHTAAEVLSDLVLASQLLHPGGVLLCDDSVFWRHVPKNQEYAVHSPVEMSPRMAVESFLFCNWDMYKPVIIPDPSQTCLIKMR